MKQILIKTLIVLIGIVAFTHASEDTHGKFSGLVFGDYYYVVSNHNPSIKNANGFWIRRIYFTYDKPLSKAFTIRLRMEMSHPGDFQTKAAPVPFVKDAYLKYQHGNHAFFFGISPTPMFTVIEKIWGYRPVEKTPLDLQKFSSTREMGFAIKGSLDREKQIRYHVMIGNGNSNKSETDQGKKISLSLGYYSAHNFLIVLDGEYNDLPGQTDWYTAQILAGYVAPQFRLGLQFARQTRQQGTLGNKNLDIASFFVAGQLSKHLNAFFRTDRMFSPNPAGNQIAYLPFDPSAASTFFVTGIDWTPIANVHFMPNVEAVTYDANSSGQRPTNDLMPRLTFYYKF